MSEDSGAVEAAAAREILSTCFDEPDAELAPQEGGLSNWVFEAMTSRGPLILRIGEAEEKEAVFARECRAISRAVEAGVPAPDVIGEGRHGDRAYMIARKSVGEPATDHPQRLDILRDLARLAATKIHSIATRGFGSDFAFDGDGTDAACWRGWLENELQAVVRLDQLCAHGVITKEQRGVFLETLATVKGWNERPVLNHGDLRLKNLLVKPDGTITALLDWEHCISAIGPHWDLSIALHDLSIDQKEAFLEGYGLTPDEVREFAPVWRLFNTLNYAPELERAVREGDDDAIDRLRNRFSGSLDLYGETECRT